MPGLNPPLREDLEAYGAVAPCRVTNATQVSWFRYLWALLRVFLHILLTVFVVWISLSFAHWDFLDEPIREGMELSILRSAPPGFSECWSPSSLFAPSTVRSTHFCELRATNLRESRARSMLTLLTGPWIVGQTVVNWFDGSYFPFIAARSFHLVTSGKEIRHKVPAMSLSDLLSMVVIAAFFCYAGAWVTVLLYLRLHDAASDFQRFQTSAQLLVCCIGLVSKLKTWMLFLVLYVLACSLMAYTSSLLVLLVPLALVSISALAVAAHRPEYALASRSWLPTMKEAFFDFYANVYDQD